MPDVLTHLLVGVSVALLVRRDDNRPQQMLIILGALLIDIERPISWLLEMTDFGWIQVGDSIFRFGVICHLVLPGSSFRGVL